MDGTLLNSASRLSPVNEAAVKRCTQSGVLFVLCTGRSVQAAAPFYRQLALSTPIITYNGARIESADGRVCVYEEALEPVDTDRLIALGREMDAAMCVWSEGRLYMNKFTEASSLYVDLSFVEAIPFSPEEPCFAGKRITKILWAETPERVRGLLPALAGKVPESVSCFTSSPEYIEFVKRGVSKGAGLLRLCRQLGIDPSETVAIGDGENDIPMLRAAGLGIAMGGAADAVRAAADLVTLTNDENGVAAALTGILENRI